MATIRSSLDDVFEMLDLKIENGLVVAEQPSTSAYQHVFFKHAKDKLGVDAVYFLRLPGSTPRIPLIYFATMESYNADKIAELHRISWNLGEAPLLFIVLPDQLLVYNNYQLPGFKEGKLDPSAGLFEKIELIYTIESARQQLMKYHRTRLETGDFWKDKKDRFDIKKRVDTTLIENLKVMRSELLKNIPNVSVVHSLLGRSIFIKYLEDRKDRNGDTVFPNGFFETFLPNSKKFTDVLCDKEATYNLFNYLHKKFNGDLFPVTPEEKLLVDTKDLMNLREFISGTLVLANSQMTLWPLYTFDAIPIQLISNIYEMFFHLQSEEAMGKKKAKMNKKGTYYTPFHLVELLLDEILPWEGEYRELRILDPSCGSGIFLVESYRRQLGRWLFTHRKDTIDPDQLISILTNNIFGVDCNEEAIRVASFSLCLTLCDFLEPKSIWDKLRFPALRKKNLYALDFFQEEASFGEDFDIIIGNPPWESKLSPDAEKYIEASNNPIGDKQIAQAFSWRAGEICKEDGNICLLMPSKGFLFNRSNTNRAYRNSFFSKFHVSTIVNFSPFRKVLFDNASGPAVAVFYSHKRREIDNSPMLYCTPKPTYTIEDRRQFVIDPLDIARIPRDLIYEDHIWKISMWGGPRDFDLINKLRNNKKMKDVIKDFQMISAEGYKRGNQTKNCSYFKDKPQIKAQNMKRYTIPENMTIPLDEEWFECTVEKNRPIFSSPHLIIKQSPVKGEGFFAAYLEYDAVFNHSLLGISSSIQNAVILKYICLLVNSKIFMYYALLTSRRWLVERDELEAGEIWDFPIPINQLNDQFKERIEKIFDLAVKEDKNSQDLVENFAAEAFKLSAGERKLIDDAIDITFDYFRLHNSSHAVHRPSDPELVFYEKTISEIWKESFRFDKGFKVQIITGDAPLFVAKIHIGKGTNINDNNMSIDEKTGELLGKLDKMLLERRSQGVYVRRNVRIYERDIIYVVKPAQKRYWSYSAACRDADEIFADIMRTWRQEQ